MPLDVDEIEGEGASEGEDAEGAEEAPSLIHTTLQAALSTARDRLLDRSLRNKLISTNITSDRARQVRVFDELADQVVATLKTGVQMTFAPGAGRGEAAKAELAGSPGADVAEWAPPEGGDLDENGVAARHRDRVLQTRLTPEGLEKRLTSLFYEGQTIEEEQGVSVLFLALGFLEWREANHSDVARFAPLALLPVQLTRSSAGARFRLSMRPDDLFTNISLQAWLREQFDIRLPDLPDIDDLTPSAYFAEVERAIGDRPGWKVHANEIVLGFFSFSKFLLWRDLDPENWPEALALLGSELLKRILLRDDGDELVDTPIIDDDAVIEEAFKTAELIHVTDADSSQAIAIQEAMAGKNLVIQGPPGTGKSQTITNIIAGAVQRGKRVLFVAEKMAALEVVHKRLVDRKLGPLCLELHSRKSSKAQVLAQIKEGRAAPAPPKWSQRSFDELDDVQAQLRAHSRRLHTLNGAALTPFDILGGISRWKALGTPAPAFQLASAGGWTGEQVAFAQRRAEGLSGRLLEAGRLCTHPWRGLGLSTVNELVRERLEPPIRAAVELFEALAAEVSHSAALLGLADDPVEEDITTWVAALAHLGRRPPGIDDLLSNDALMPLRTSLLEVAQAGEELAAVRGRLREQVRPEALSLDWTNVRRVIVGHGRSPLRMLSSKYRGAVAELRGVWAGSLPKAHASRLMALDGLIETTRLAEVIRAASTALAPSLGAVWRGEQTDWTLMRAAVDWMMVSERFEPGIALRTPDRLRNSAVAEAAAPKLNEALDSANAGLGRLMAGLEMDRAVALDGRSNAEVSVSELLALTLRWRDELGTIAQWPPVAADLAWFEDIGAGDLARGVFRGEVQPEHLVGVLMLAVYEAMWARVRAANPGIENTLGDDLTRLVQRFRRADLDRIRIAADEVARAHLDQHPTGVAGAVGVLIEETKKTRRLKPVRKLMEEAGEAIQRFKPVFLMSPLSVAQFLPPGRVKFDLLVIDEASQVRPEDALGAIARCGQLVVVGDDKQLPPTSFFSRMVNDDDGPDDDEELVEGQPRKAAVRDIESILNLCIRFPEKMLRWHYRSEHPALIATSNRYFYDGKLMLPPSVLATASDGETGLIFHQIERGGYERGKTARNEIEAEEVAQAVLAHARKTPDLSLAVGTFSVAQRDAVRDRIEVLARRHPELDEFQRTGAHGEAFFVKNLENIQGDERDVIFISIGYGHFKDGRLTQQFGPVGREGGERRLNVLITRARKRCEVFSSIVAEDIRIEGSAKPGVAALQAFLKLAKDGFLETATPTDRTFDSDFEEAVALELEKLGYKYHPQVGMAGFFIDIGVLDPRQPDRYLLGIECDGAAYHSSRYARDRDRLRQQILESRGWKLHRIWSTDWFHQRGREIEKLQAAIMSALAGAALPSAANVYDNEPMVPADLPLDHGGVEGLAEEEAEFEDDAVQPRAGRAALPPYEFTKYRHWSSEPHTLSEVVLAEIVVRIIKDEQPIHGEEVARRLAHVCGLQRAGSRIQDAARRGLRQAKIQRRIESDGDFWTEAVHADLEPRSRADLAVAEMVRKPEMISGAELAAAARIALVQNLALSEDDLVVETARLIGFARVGENVGDAVQDGIERYLGDELEHDHLDRLKLKD